MLIFSKHSAIMDEQITLLFARDALYGGLVHLYLHFLHEVSNIKYLWHWKFYTGNDKIRNGTRNGMRLRMA